MKNISNVLIMMMVVCSSFAQEELNDQQKIDKVLTTWHEAASNANFDVYFSKMTADAIFIGTDPTENWELSAFKDFSKPYFDAGKAWSFTAIERNIFVSNDIAWFDELLDTQMKICRGSGVLIRVNGVWKIKHYVLSIAIPNENVKDVVLLKQDFDDKIIKKLN